MNNWILPGIPHKKDHPKTVWNMKLMRIPIFVGALGTVPKTRKKKMKELGIREKVVIIQTTALLRLPIKPRRVLDTSGGILSLILYWEIFNWGLCKKKKNSQELE